MTDDHERLAWAAGVFEASGSATMSDGRPMLNLKQRQPEKGPSPDGLVQRFHAAIGGLGRIGGPYAPGGLGKSPLEMWYARTEEAAEVMELLWPWLGAEKRAQWNAAAGRAE